MRVVSLPAVGSVTPNACSRSAPITYICAWQAAALPPCRWISSSTTLASAIPSPEPPYASGMSAASQPALVSASTNSLGYRRRRSWSRQYASPARAQMSRIAERISGYPVSSMLTDASLLGAWPPSEQRECVVGVPVLIPVVRQVFARREHAQEKLLP